MSTYRTPFKGEDLLECAGDAPTLYGRKIARKLWSREELSNSIVLGERFGVQGVSPQSHDTAAKALFRG